MATIYKVQAPDGSILEIEGPDGADEAQIMQAAADLYQPQQQAAPQQPVQAPQFGGMESATEIPGQEFAGGMGVQVRQPPPEPGPQGPFAESEIMGAAETALTMGTAATSGTVGLVAGTLQGLAKEIESGQFGTAEAAKRIRDLAMKASKMGTYEPKYSKTGQRNVQAIGEALSPLPPVLGVGPLGSNIPQRIKPFTGMADDVPVRPTRVGEAAPAVSPAPAVAAAAAPILDDEMARIGDLARRASGGSKAAQEKLADKASINLEALASAERLGIELPADVFSNNYQVRSAAGLTRSKAASEAESMWNATVKNAVDRADEIFAKDIGATYVEGVPSVGVISYNVLNTLNDSMATLKSSAKTVYDKVDSFVPLSTKVQLNKLNETLNKISSEVGPGGLSAAESKLLTMMRDGSITYGRLKREKDLMRQAKEGKESIYGNMQESALKRLYAALQEDQLEIVGRIAGPDVRQDLRAANHAYAKAMGIGKRIVSSFGREGDGSIANLMLSAIKSAGKGDSAKFTKLMKVVPKELQKDVIATALAGIARSRSGASAVKGSFGFSEFSDLYKGLRANSPVYKAVIETLGKDADKVLRDMYSVANRVTTARAMVLSTGKANQSLLESMTAENLVANIMRNTASKAAAHAAAAAMGPVGGGAMSIALDALSGGNKDALKAAGALFNSEEFKALAVAAATRPEISPMLVRRVAVSAAFRNFVANSTVPMPRGQNNLEAWIFDAIQRETRPQDEDR